MTSTRIVSGAAVLVAALACGRPNHGTMAGDESRIKASSDSSASRDTAARYGNQESRMGAPGDTNGKARGPATTASTAGQGDANLIGSPAWWRTHITADGKMKP